MIYFDITDILGFAITNPVVTGIQRGTLRIIGAAYDSGCDVCGIVKHPITGEFNSADLSFLSGGYDFSREDFLSRFDIRDPKKLWVNKKLKKYREGSISYAARKAYLEARYRLSRKTRKKIESFLKVSGKNCLGEFSPKRGDTLATLGGWGIDYIGLHALAVRNQCRTAAFVHDIFPITHHRDDCKGFRPWLNFCCANYDTIVCNSEFTASELRAYLEEEEISSNVKVSLYPHEFISPKPVRSKNGYVLCVGTQDRRKNIPMLVSSWGKIRDTLGERTPTLVIAGARTAEVRAYCTGEPHVTFIEHPSDVVLEQLYRGCLFTVFPSRCEGWGIPIGESLWFGKPVLCGNSSSMPEVGTSYANYFDVNDPESFCAEVIRMIENPRQFSESIRKDLRTWKDTAKSVVDAIDGARVVDITPKMIAAAE